MKRLLLGIGLFSIAAAHAQLPRVDIPGSEVRKLLSKEVPGQEYELDVSLPGGYTQSGKSYPVLYLMDSQWDFPLAKSLYGQQYFDGFVPEMIIVGITWGGTNPNPDSLRARDYTPTKERRLPQSGGADNFLAALQKEIIPYVESTYRADAANRTLMGCSLGGLFTMYTLFTHPDMFSNYIAASPAFSWDKEVLYQYEKKYYESHPGLPARLYITVGEVEKGVPGFEKLVAFLNARNYRNIKFKSKVLENTGHSGTKSEGFGRGMQFAFERPSLHIDAGKLTKWIGRYETEKNETIEILVDNYVPYCIVNNNRYKLLIASETEAYATSEFFNIRFQVRGEQAESLVLNRYGRSDTAMRAAPPRNENIRIIKPNEQ